MKLRPPSLPVTWSLFLAAVVSALVVSAAVGPVVFGPEALGEDEGAEIGRSRDGRTTAPSQEQPPEVVAKTIDLFVAAAWEREGLDPAATSSDGEFVRRVYLDVVGTVPSAEQVVRFTKDRSADKRARLVDALLESPGYARHMANLWGQVLVGQGTNQNNRSYNPATFMRWLEEQILLNRPYAELVQEMLSAEGTWWDNPAVNFGGRRDHNPTDMAGAVSKAFLGVQIQCAQCHDHPYEEITQTDFQGFAAFWSRMTLRPEAIPYESFGKNAARRQERQVAQRVKSYVEQGMSREEAVAQAERRRPKSFRVGEIGGGSRFPKALMNRRRRQIGDVAGVAPKFLLGDTYTDRGGETRRGALATWIGSPDNPYTARALANRYWGWFLGRGFVNPVDDFSSVNIPSVPQALDVLADDTAEHGFDLKRLVRVITASQAYQLSTEGAERTELRREFFAAGPLKPLTPQQTFDSMQVALGVSEDGTAMSGLEGSLPTAVEMEGGKGGRRMTGGDDESRSRRYLRGAARTFFQTFDDDEGGETTDFEGTIPQGLFLMNSQVVNGLLTNPSVSVVPKVVRGFTNESDRIRHLFLRTLSRQPTRAELGRFVQFVKTSPEHTLPESDATKNKRRRKGRGRKMQKEDAAVAAYADVLWTLVSTSEFATNH